RRGAHLRLRARLAGQRLLRRRALHRDDRGAPDPALRPVRHAAGGARVRRLIALALVAAAAIVLPFGLDARQLTTATFVAIAAIGTLGLNVLTGYTGQVSLGHAFFLAVGAYTAAVLGGNAHLTAAIWLPAAGLTAAACGALVGPTALRLHGLYLAIV